MRVIKYPLGMLALTFIAALGLSCSESKLAGDQSPKTPSEKTDDEKKKTPPVSKDPIIPPVTMTPSPDPTPATPQVTCSPKGNFTVFSYCGLPSTAQGLKAGNAKFTLPADATEIAFTLVSASVDDYAPTLNIGTERVWSFSENRLRAHQIPINLSIANKIKAGENIFSATVMDGYGTCVSAAFQLHGTYKASVCKSSLEP